MTGNRSSLTFYLLLLIGGSLFATQYVTIVKFSVLPPSASYIQLEHFAEAVQDQIQFNASDYALFVLLFTAVVSVLYREIRAGDLTWYLQQTLSNNRKAVSLLLGCALVCVRYYFAPGELSWAGDASHHIVTAQLAATTIRDGELPVWTFYMGNGSPYLQNYGFVFFYLVGFVDLVFGDIFTTLKLVMVVTHVLSGLGMYRLTERLCHSRRAGFVAGLGYVLCFWHVQHVLIMGRLPLSLFYALLPWTFYAVETLIHSRYKIRAAALGGAGIALMNCTHPGFGLYAMLLLGVYSLCRLWACTGRGDLKAITSSGALLFAFGIVLGAYMNVGMWSELKHTNMHDFELLAATPEHVVPDPTMRHVLGWSNFRFWLVPPEPFHWYGGYMGISLCILALYGVVAVCGVRVKSGARRFAGGLACLALVVLVVFAYRWPPFNLIQFVQVFNASRYLLFLSFFLAMAAGVGTHLILLNRLWGWKRSRLFTLAILLVLIDLVPTTFQHPYRSGATTPSGLPEEIFSDIAAAADPFIARGESPNYWVQWVAEGLHPYLSTARLLFLGATPTSEAFHPGELRALNTFTKPFVDIARKLMGTLGSSDQFYSHPYGHLLASGFSMLNTRFVLYTSQSNGVGFLLEFDDHSPILASPRLEEYHSEDVAVNHLHESMREALDIRSFESSVAERISKVLWIITRTSVRLEDRTCDRILVRGLESEIDLGTTPSIEIVAHEVDHQRVDLKVDVSAPCYARLSYAYFPFLEVTVDGKPVEVLETAGCFIALKLEPGEREIALQARLSPLRRGLLWIALAASLGMGALVVREKYRKFKRPLPS